MKLPSAYEPNHYEADMYSLWEKSGVFTPKRAAHEDSFSIMMPLPNANARLHIGSALFVTLQDIATRYQRMRGKSALWLPGADHAGFETWVVYEKKLAAEGKSRFDYSREELYKQVWDFVASNRRQFEQQFRELGASVDWSRFAFSLDDKIVKQVYETFKKLWDDELVYRGERVVNFCTFHGTSFADIEVEYKDEKSKLWYIRYPLTDEGGEVVVATTRPETMLGDTAVAVNPKDKRYARFIGKTVKLPLTGREVPVITDDFVDPKFGTGAVKLTPAHDPTDFEAAKRHNLPLITVIDHTGKMNANVPEPYRGLTVEEARDKVVYELDKQSLLEKVEDYTHSVGHCYKCGRVIQPLLREQWFIDMKPLAADAIKVLEAKKIKFYPEAKRTQLIGYLGGLRDWNISRQIAWGIPIPAFQNVDDPDDWIFDERVGEETLEIDGKTYRRDPDVFDTWFSSSQWPFATLGLGSEDFKQFYPTSLMETGGEILYPWVSRMIMLGLYMTGDIPFKDVYIHGYVLASDGAKMSKSLGNVIDPDSFRTKYGADALRLGLVDDRAPAVNRPFDETKTIAGRNFCNKLWNIARFSEGFSAEITDGQSTAKTPADHWILNKLSNFRGHYKNNLDKYRFSEAYAGLYHFVWNDLADWYLEAGKAPGGAQPVVLAQVLQDTLKLAHPFAPFVTEAIWQKLEFGKGSLLAGENFPQERSYDMDQAVMFSKVVGVVGQIRRINSLLEIRAERLYYLNSDSNNSAFETQAELLKKLSGLATVKKVPERPDSGLRLPIDDIDAWIEIEPQKAEQYLSALREQIKSRSEATSRLEKRLNNKSYVSNAPKEIVAETRQQLTSEQSLLIKLKNELAELEKA